MNVHVHDRDLGTDYVNTTPDACAHCGKCADDISECDICNGKTFSFSALMEATRRLFSGELFETFSSQPAHHGGTGEQRLKPVSYCAACGCDHAAGEHTDMGGNKGTSASRKKDQRANHRGALRFRPSKHP